MVILPATGDSLLGIMMVKTCVDCNQTLPILDFDIRSDRGTLRPFCKECRKDRQNKRNIVLHPDTATGQKRKQINAKNFKATHGISYNTHLKRTNVQHKLRQNIRKRINITLKQKSFRIKTEEGLGCSLVYLKAHLESLFQLNMTWDNYGKGGWEIDHIKPLSSFDLTDKDQLKKACHYTNLQPLWMTDNRKKSDTN